MLQEYIAVKLLNSPNAVLEIIKTIAGVLTPIIAAFFGLAILRHTKNIEHSQWRNQKLIERRIKVWDDLSSDLNDIYCYCSRIGNWKEKPPLEIIKAKRCADKIMYSSRPYFGDRFFRAYTRFMKLCFLMFQGHGEDAKLRTPMEEHSTAFRGNWNKEWDVLFSTELSNEEELFLAYNHLLSAATADISPEVRNEPKPQWFQFWKA